MDALKGLLSWGLGQRYKSEKRWLESMGVYANTWYNELTGPLSGLLVQMSLDTDEMSPEEYVQIARRLFKERIKVNAGDELDSTLTRMGKRGIPLITGREELARRTKEFLQSGVFVKLVACGFAGWQRLSPTEQQALKQELLKKWRLFENSKNRLIEEIDSQLAKLG